MATATNPIPSSSSARHSPRSPNSRWAGSSPWTQIVRDCDSDYIVSSSSTTAAVAINEISLHSPSLSSVLAREANASSSPASSDSSPSGAAATLVAVAGSMTCPTVESGAAAETPPESTETGGGSSSGSNATKKPAWNKPSNGATAEISAVMGAESWPALSESTRASTKKSSSSDSLKALSDGTVSSQGTGVGFPSTYKQDTSSNTNPNLSPHNVGPTRQRSMKHVGGGMSSSDGSANDYVSQSLPPEGAAVELVSNNLGKSGGSAGESSVRDNTNREGGQSGGSHGGNVLQHQRNSFRRGSGGPHPRGDVSHYHGRGGRRDRDRGNQDWDTHRSFGSREGNMPQQRVARPFIRGPVPSTPYIPPPPLAVRPPFGTPMVYTEVRSPVFYVTGTQPDSLRMPMVPIRPMFFPVTDPHLSNKIMCQIDYYFSNENLVKDTFLRQNMDEEGWVPIQLIAGFKKVMELTDNVQLILESVQASNIVEVQVDKVRRKNDWMKWIMPPIQM